VSDGRLDDMSSKTLKLSITNVAEDAMEQVARIHLRRICGTRGAGLPQRLVCRQANDWQSTVSCSVEGSLEAGTERDLS
jgi:hypothetical protein